jgi:DNA-binding GntR family transcriptional regulator
VSETAGSVKDHRPIYVQIAEKLRARILSGYYDEKISGELPLAREWQVSRRTIQQSLDLLVDEGLLVRQHGLGTFINRKGVAKRYRAITSLTEGIAGQGLKPEATVLSSGPDLADAEERVFFGLGPEARIYRHRRLLSAEDRPLAIAEAALNLSLLPGLELSHLDRSLYGKLRDAFGRTIVEVEDQYVPAITSQETAELLRLPPGSPVFLAIRRARDQEGSPIELSRVTMLPVPLDISIRHIGFPPDAGELSPAASNDWTYSVGFGNFRR